MRIYFDNCCFNRPFDDQGQIRVRLEAEAKLAIQGRVQAGRLELVWSYILDYENRFNPFDERRNAIREWKSRAKVNVRVSQKVLEKAGNLAQCGIRAKDALHLACAIEGKCKYFLTTDDVILTKMADCKEVAVVDPTEFIVRERK